MFIKKFFGASNDNMMFAISFDPLQNKLKNLGKTWIYSVLVLGANNWWSHCARLQKQSTHVVVEFHLELSKYHPGYFLKYLLRKRNQFLLEMGNFETFEKSCGQFFEYFNLPLCASLQGNIAANFKGLRNI